MIKYWIIGKEWFQNSLHRKIVALPSRRGLSWKPRERWPPKLWPQGTKFSGYTYSAFSKKTSQSLYLSLLYIFPLCINGKGEGARFWYQPPGMSLKTPAEKAESLLFYERKLHYNGEDYVLRSKTFRR